MSADPSCPYPQAPWKLHGHAFISAWRVPIDDLPMKAASGARLVTFGRQAICTTVWAVYEQGGTLAYNELLFATAVRKSGLLAPACTVGPIWVDDEAAAAGGRMLWGIPKRMGLFEPLRADGSTSGLAAGTEATVTAQGQLIAALQFRPGLRISIPLRLALWTVQDGPAGPIRTRCTLRGKLCPGAAQWRIAADGPLGFLAGRQPLASARLDRLSAWFGV